MIYHRFSSYIKTTGATIGAGTAYLSRAAEFTPGFKWGSCYSIFRFMCMFCRSSFVLFLLAIVLPVFRRFTDSDYPFGIFKLFLYCGVTCYRGWLILWPLLLYMISSYCGLSCYLWQLILWCLLLCMISHLVVSLVILDSSSCGNLIMSPLRTKRDILF